MKIVVIMFNRLGTISDRLEFGKRRALLSSINVAMELRTKLLVLRFPQNDMKNTCKILFLAPTLEL